MNTSMPSAAESAAKSLSAIALDMSTTSSSTTDNGKRVGSLRFTFALSCRKRGCQSRGVSSPPGSSTPQCQMQRHYFAGTMMPAQTSTSTFNATLHRSYCRRNFHSSWPQVLNMLRLQPRQIAARLAEQAVMPSQVHREVGRTILVLLQSLRAAHSIVSRRWRDKDKDRCIDNAIHSLEFLQISTKINSLRTPCLDQDQSLQQKLRL